MVMRDTHNPDTLTVTGRVYVDGTREKREGHQAANPVTLLTTRKKQAPKWRRYVNLTSSRVAQTCARSVLGAPEFAGVPGARRAVRQGYNTRPWLPENTEPNPTLLGELRSRAVTVPVWGWRQIMMEENAPKIKTLTWYLVALRPDWDQAGVAALLTRAAAKHPWRQVEKVALTLAWDKGEATPAPIDWAQRYNDAIECQVYSRPLTGTWCETCGRVKVTGDGHVCKPGDAQRGISLARSALKQS